MTPGLLSGAQIVSVDGRDATDLSVTPVPENGEGGNRDEDHVVNSNGLQTNDNQRFLRAPHELCQPPGHWRRFVDATARNELIDERKADAIEAAGLPLASMMSSTRGGVLSSTAMAPPAASAS